MTCKWGYTVQACEDKFYVPCGKSVCELEGKNTLYISKYRSYRENHKQN